jgi:hypothetical protein
MLFVRCAEAQDRFSGAWFRCRRWVVPADWRPAGAPPVLGRAPTRAQQIVHQTARKKKHG